MMAYNNYRWNPYYQNQQNSGPTWVQGESAAKAWFVPPGTTVALWDSEAQTIYLKSADASGMPSMKVLDYVVRDAQTAQNSVSDAKVEYLTKNDLEAVYEAIRELRDDIDSLSIRKVTKKKEIIEE